ncbi:MAG: radical SAM protein [Schwartzia sp.]|nr:radical SAM protein [Schwartzia sp. (in: firmicutes)]MBR5162942.1 radical SAM protein [Schwartzia sp. (in: firmicutes)]
MAKITALYADENGEIFFAAGMAGAARLGNEVVRLTEDMLIPLPDAADLMFLPERRAVGYDKKGNLTTLPGRAVSAVLPAGYTRLFLPAFKKENDASMLPLFGYTAVALRKGSLYAAALYTDKNDKWDPLKYNTRALKRHVRELKKRFPDNRLVAHLAHCSLEWHCCTAQNLFYHRWEAGIPVSPVCNANCLGCISLQPAECCPSPQSRISFRPTVDEVTELSVYHLSEAPDAIISFGQGCEGEPSLAADVIAESIRATRAKTNRGQININTNAGFTDGIKKIVDAGLDTMRVSIISARNESYQAYYRAGYPLENVKASIRYALEHGVYVSLNLLYFPGFNDRPEELAAWKEFFREQSVQMIQIRNLNLDPDFFLKTMPPENKKPLGAQSFLHALHEAFPSMTIGSFSHFVK